MVVLKEFLLTFGTIKLNIILTLLLDVFEYHPHGTLTEVEMHSTVDLLIKIGCFVKKTNLMSV
jgi:hypothetical protein